MMICYQFHFAKEWLHFFFGALVIGLPCLSNRSLIISVEHYYDSTYERARNGIINQPLLLMSLLLD